MNIENWKCTVKVDIFWEGHKIWKISLNSLPIMYSLCNDCNVKTMQVFFKIVCPLLSCISELLICVISMYVQKTVMNWNIFINLFSKHILIFDYFIFSEHACSSYKWQQPHRCVRIGVKRKLQLFVHIRICRWRTSR